MMTSSIRGLMTGLSAFVVCIGMISLAQADDGNGNKSVTVASTEASLVGTGSQTAAKGRAESSVITITNKKKNTTTTSSTLTAAVKGLTLADAAVVTFQLNGTTIGTGTVKSGRASLKLSSKKGDTVPAVKQGDTLTVLDPVGTNVVDLSGAFGPITTHNGNGDGGGGGDN